MSTGFSVDDKTDDELADIAVRCATELYAREQESRLRQLDGAKKQWLELIPLFEATGIDPSRIDLGRGPVLVEWADVPMLVGTNNGYFGNKPKSKREALSIARRHGDGGWMTVAELRMFLFGFGPVIERAMHKMGFGGRGAPPPDGFRKPEKRTIAELASKE